MTVGYLYNAAVNLLNKFILRNLESFNVSTSFRGLHQKKLVLSGYINLFSNTEFQPNESSCWNWG